MMKKQHFLMLGISLLAFVQVTGCGIRVNRGSGDLVTEERSVRGFDEIDFSGSGDLIVTQDGTESLTVRSDDNLMAHIITEVKGRRLELGFDRDVVSSYLPTELVYTLSVDDLREISISGSGEFVAEKIDADRLEIKISGSGRVKIEDLEAGRLHGNISGSGRIELVGEAAVQEIDITGSGKFIGEDLLGHSVDVKISGSGTASVWATESLDAHTSGSGSIDYYGSPQANTSSSGSGNVRHRRDK